MKPLLQLNVCMVWCALLLLIDAEDNPPVDMLLLLLLFNVQLYTLHLSTLHYSVLSSNTDNIMETQHFLSGIKSTLFLGQL